MGSTTEPSSVGYWAAQSPPVAAVLTFPFAMLHSCALLGLRLSVALCLCHCLAQGDVIDTQFELLMQSINHARDFDAIGAAHHNYITALLVQTFRTTPSVRRLLGDIFALCESLCDLVERGIWRDTSGFAELDRVETGFQRQTAFLFKMLTSASSKDHLSQLLLRINYNQYFSQIIGDV